MAFPLPLLFLFSGLVPLLGTCASFLLIICFFSPTHFVSGALDGLPHLGSSFTIFVGIVCSRKSNCGQFLPFSSWLHKILNSALISCLAPNPSPLWDGYSFHTVQQYSSPNFPPCSLQRFFFQQCGVVVGVPPPPCIYDAFYIPVGL